MAKWITFSVTACAFFIRSEFQLARQEISKIQHINCNEPSCNPFQVWTQTFHWGAFNSALTIITYLYSIFGNNLLVHIAYLLHWYWCMVLCIAKKCIPDIYNKLITEVILKQQKIVSLSRASVNFVIYPVYPL